MVFYASNGYNELLHWIEVVVVNCCRLISIAVRCLYSTILFLSPTGKVRCLALCMVWHFPFRRKQGKSACSLVAESSHCITCFCCQTQFIGQTTQQQQQLNSIILNKHRLPFLHFAQHLARFPLRFKLRMMMISALFSFFPVKPPGMSVVGVWTQWRYSSVPPLHRLLSLSLPLVTRRSTIQAFSFSLSTVLDEHVAWCVA